MRRRTATAVTTAAGLALAALGVGVSQAQPLVTATTSAALRIGVSSVQYDSPGATVPAIVTVYGAPKNDKITISATGTAGATVTCSGAVWRNPVRHTASRTCYLRMPAKTGTYTIKATARLTKGKLTRVVKGSSTRPVTADGKPSPTPMPAATIRQIERCGNTTNNVWLTFDDGGSATQVTAILATLKRNNVKARFFFRGDWAAKNPTLMTRIKTAGHLIGNHTATHRALSRESRTRILQQIDGGTAATGTPKLLRPPFGAGAFTTRLQHDAKIRGYQLCRWTTDTYDWQGTSVARMVERITYGDHLSAPISAGGTILMHAHAKNTAPGLQHIINAVRARHLTLQPMH